MEKCNRKIWRKETLEKVFLFVWLLLLGGFGVYFYLKLEPIPLVIFAGGGSVKNYIDSTKHVRIDSISSDVIPKSVYINVPSEYGWTLLKEEINRFKGDFKPHPFLYICLSADSIDRDSRNKIWLTGEDRKDSCDARIYGCYFGDDPLMVYADTGRDDTISVESLRRKIEPFLSKDEKERFEKGKLYATSRKSGTLRRYESVLGVSFDSISNTLFYERDVLKDSDAAVVLGSKHYRPKTENSVNKWLYVVDKEGDTIKKPLYIYFVVFKENYFKPNKQIINFFESLKITIPEPIKNGEGIENDLNRYPGWCEFNISN